MFGINEKSLADNRTLVTINRTLSDISTKFKNGTINYTQDDDTLWVTNPKVRIAYAKKDPKYTLKFDRILTAKNGTDIDFPPNFLEDATFRKNVLIKGNLIVEGNSTVIDTPHLAIEDNIIDLNKNEKGAGISLNQAGISINRGTLGFGRLLFNEIDKSFVLDNCESSNGTSDDWAIKVYTSTQNGKTKGELEARAAISAPDGRFSNCLTVAKRATARDIVAENNAHIKNDLIVSNMFTVAGQSTMRGPTFINNSLGVLGISTFKENALFNKDVIIDGNTTIKQAATFNKKLSVLGEGIEATGDSIFNNNLEVKGDMNIVATASASNLNISGLATLRNITSTGTSRIDELIVSRNINCSGAITANSSITAGTNLAVGGTSTFNGKASFKNDVSITGSANISTDGSISGNLTVGGKIISNGGLEVEGGQTVTGNLDVLSISTNSVHIKHSNENKIIFKDDSQAVYVSESNHQTLGGYVSGADANSHNMYFIMNHDTKGFVFKNQNKPLLQIQKNKILSANDIYVKGSKVLSTLDEGHGKGIDADTIDGKHSGDIILRDGSHSMLGDLDMNSCNIKFSDNDILEYTEGMLDFKSINANNNFKLKSKTIDTESISFGDKNILSIKGNYLNINSKNSFSSGVDFGESSIKTNNSINIGENGSVLKINNSEFTYKGRDMLLIADPEITKDLDMGSNKILFSTGEIKPTSLSLEVNSSKNLELVSKGLGRISLTDTKAIFSHNPYFNANKILHTGDEGHGKGIDADTIDGKHHSDLRAEFVNVTGDKMTGTLTIEKASNQLNLSNGTSKAIVSTSATEGEYIFGGTLISESEYIKDYIRISRNKLAFTTNNVTHLVYHQGNKPTWADIEGEMPNIPPSSHNHDDRYYTETEINNKLKAITDVLDVIDSQVNVVHKELINANQWTAEGNMFAYTINHAKGILLENIDVNGYDEQGNVLVVPYTFINNNSIKVYSDNRDVVTISINGISMTKQSSFAKELEDARGDSYNSLKEHLEAIHKEIAEIKNKLK